MQARPLLRLMQQKEPDRREEIAEGLDLLEENIATLGDDLEVLRAAGRRRGLWMLANQADEEAAKALILLDFVRMDQGDHEAATNQLKRFYDHLSRCIYVEVTQMNPADFAEVRRMVASLRPSHHLDGPTGVDWIFRNPLLQNREDRLYVDFGQEDEGESWKTPARDDEVRFGGPPAAVRDLVGAMHRVGCASGEGLTVLAEAWAGQEFNDATRWQEIAAINQAVVATLLERGLARPEATQDDVNRVIDRWGFPLSGITLSEKKVSLAALRREQEQWVPE